MHVYKNPDYYPKINVFEGDDYLKEDTEVVDFSDDLMDKIRRLKRRYRNYLEWTDAMEAYQEYTLGLIEKYGGKKKFEFTYLTGRVKEFIPPCPELRETKENRMYIHEGAVPVEVPEDTRQYSEHMWEPKGVDYWDVDISFKRSMEVPYEVSQGLSKNHFDVSQELDIISRYFNERRAAVTKHRKLTKKQLKRERRRALKRQYTRDITMTDRMKAYYDAKFESEYDKKRTSDPNKAILYKGIMVSPEQAEELEVDAVLRNYGIFLDRKSFSKATGKVIRRVKKNEKKGKKKKKKMNRFMENFSEEYNTFEAFEKEMQSLVSSSLPVNR